MEAEAAFFGQLKYLDLVRAHIESVPSNPILCIPMEKQECFHIQTDTGQQGMEVFNTFTITVLWTHANLVVVE